MVYDHQHSDICWKDNFDCAFFRMHEFWLKKYQDEFPLGSKERDVAYLEVAEIFSKMMPEGYKRHYKSAF